jgi:hypothetical protein
MSKIWNYTEIQSLIKDEIQESLTLEYKAADSLGKSDGKKKEITKDISAMANSAGGTIIYGIAEYQDPARQHLPEKISPVDQTEFSKEWLEQIINTIRPRIDGIVITPISLTSSPKDVVYVVEIPQSNTAHQATDWRYYKRFNFLSVPMEDYEVRDIMSRQQYPIIELEFNIEVVTRQYSRTELIPGSGEVEERTEYELKIIANNVGQIFAQYVNAFIQLPFVLAYEDEFEKETPVEVDGKLYAEYYEDNTIRDVVDVQFNIYGSIDKYGPSRYDPILPKLSRTWSIRLNDIFPTIDKSDLSVTWTVYADNAQPQTGQISIKDIPVIDMSKKA